MSIRPLMLSVAFAFLPPVALAARQPSKPMKPATRASLSVVGLASVIDALLFVTAGTVR